MATILNNAAIDKPLNKVVELKYGFILNGHYYDKKTMTPKPLMLFPTFGDAGDMCLNKSSCKVNNSMVDSTQLSEMVISDSYNPSITFVITSGTKSVTPMSVLKVAETENDCHLLANRLYEPNSYFTGYLKSCREYIGQNRDYLFITSASSVSSMTTYLVRIEKNTLEQTAIVELPRYGVTRKVAETGQYIYLFHATSGTGLTAYRVDKMSNTQNPLTVTSYSYGSAYRQPYPSNGIEVAPGEFLVYTLNELSGSKIQFVKRIVNTNDTSLTTCAKKNEGPVTVDFGTTLDSERLTLPGSDLKYRFLLEITESNGKKFLNVLFYDVTGNLNASSGLYGIYTYEIDMETYNLTFIGSTRISGCIPYGFVFNKEKNKILASCDFAIKEFSFDNSTKLFKETLNVNSSSISGGYDLQENIWYMKSNFEVEMVSPTIPLDVNIRLEHDNYQFSGDDILTKVLLSCTNYNGEMIKNKVNLSIKGSAIFTSSGDKKISVETNAGSELEIPILIKDGGQLLIYPEFII